eukprot:1184677-Prorocentrum_minimum.AAC.4
MMGFHGCRVPYSAQKREVGKVGKWKQARTWSNAWRKSDRCPQIRTCRQHLRVAYCQVSARIAVINGDSSHQKQDRPRGMMRLCAII